MTTKLFISGKNWKLSLGKITTHLENRNVKFDIQFFSKEFFTIKLEPSNDIPKIEDLGGTIKIGEAKTKIPTETVKEAFLKKNKQAQSQIVQSLASSSLIDDMAKSAEKTLFGVSVYCSEKSLNQLTWDIQRFAGSAIKDELQATAISRSLWVFPEIEGKLS